MSEIKTRTACWVSATIILNGSLWDMEPVHYGISTEQWRPISGPVCLNG